MTFWDFFWLMVWGFLWVAYICVLIQVLFDIFRSDDLSGLAKAGWVIFLLIVPALSALIYVIVRGDGMTRRSSMRYAPVPEEDYVRVAQAPTPVSQIAHAKELLDSGAISTEEYDQLKSKALG